MITLFKNKSKCCICLQFKNKIKHCLKCKNAVICYNCFDSLVEKGLASKCPVCRQLEWHNSIKKTKIVPLGNTDVILKNESRCINVNKKCFCLFLFDIFRFILLLFLIYMSGLLSILIVSDIALNFLKYFWLPFFIGIIEFLILISCCYGCCNLKIAAKDICFFTFINA